MRLIFKIVLITVVILLTNYSFGQKGGGPTTFNISVTNIGDVPPVNNSPNSQYSCVEVSFIVNYTLNGTGYGQISSSQTPYMGVTANLSVTIPAGAILVSKKVKFVGYNDQYIYTVGSSAYTGSGNYCLGGGNNLLVEPASISPNVDFKVYCLGGCPL
jgi:hypothetical protein